MAFKLLEGLLHRDQVLPIVVFLQNLSVQMVIHSALKDVGVIVSVDFPSRSVKGSGVLAKELNIFLCVVAGLVDILSSFVSTTGEFF